MWEQLQPGARSPQVSAIGLGCIDMNGGIEEGDVFDAFYAGCLYEALPLTKDYRARPFTA